jgi:quercetin dioxygenase-like cupin family protein
MNARKLVAGDRTRAFDTEYTLLLTPADTEGRLSSYLSVCPPNAGPPRHIHRREDETFYVISGTVEFWIDGASRTAKAGDAAFVPRGKEHTFYVVGPDPAEMLTTLTPGGFEGFFFAVSESVLADIPAMAQFAKDFEMEVTGPPLHVP